MTARVLAVDDIAANLRLLEAKLQAEYYEVLLASSGQEALTTAFTQLPDVILLDVMMPGMDGYQVCTALKADARTQHIPVVMVTALTDSSERVRGLEVGADDFLQKPISGREIVARVRAHLRRKAPAGGQPAEAPAPGGEWRVAEASRRIISPVGEPVPLTGMEYDLLTLLMETPGEPVDRQTLSRRILKRPHRPDDRAIDNLVHNIRLKFGNEHAGGLITTVRNRGYAFTGFPRDA